MDYMLFSIYYIVPLIVKQYLGESGMWKIFFPATVVGVISINITSKAADRAGNRKVMTSLFMIALFGVALFLMSGIAPVIAGMIFFMAGFMGLKVLLPSTVNMLTQKTYRGVANGILNTCIFIGTFLGGSVTGMLWQYGKTPAIIVLIAASVIGGLISLSLKETKRVYKVEKEQLKEA
jgi:MFS family permease